MEEMWSEPVGEVIPRRDLAAHLLQSISWVLESWEVLNDTSRVDDSVNFSKGILDALEGLDHALLISNIACKPTNIHLTLSHSTLRLDPLRHLLCSRIRRTLFQIENRQLVRTGLYEGASHQVAQTGTSTRNDARLARHRKASQGAVAVAAFIAFDEFGTAVLLWVGRVGELAVDGVIGC